MKRLLLVFLALAVITSLGVGVLYAAAKGTNDRPTMKVIVLVKPKGNAANVVTKLQGEGAKNIYRYHLIKAVSATISRKMWSNLRQDGDVARIVADGTVRVPKPRTIGEGHPFSGTGSNVLEPVMEPEALQLTHAEDAWKITVGGQQVQGQGVKVGMIDTGTDPSHPDLTQAIAGYRDFTGTGLRDNVGHGTGTSSMVAAQGLPVFNGETHTYMRVGGMAPKADVYMAKVIDLYVGWDSNLIRGIEWLADQKVDMISCSLGDNLFPPDGRDPFSIAVQALVDKGIVFINSAGNEGPGQGTSGGGTAAMKDALDVGASTGNREFAQTNFLTSGSLYKGDQVIAWSSRGPNSQGDFKPDIMGFGAYGWALAPTFVSAEGKDIQEFGGTSMSAPVVAGDLALAMSAYRLAHPAATWPLESPGYWKRLLASTATDLGYPALDQSSGLANAEKAVKAVLGTGPSFLVTVGNDYAAASNWSVKAAGGSTATTTVTVKNTGDVSEHVSLTPTVFAVDAGQTLTRDVTLTASSGYTYTQTFTVPAGTDFIDTRCTWPSGPNVSLRTAVYDSDGNFLNYGPTYGGYGHLAPAQIALNGPADQRPVVTPGKPWTMVVFPRASMTPSGDQLAHLRIQFLHKQAWNALSLSSGSFDLSPGATKDVIASLDVPAAAGTHFGGILVASGGTTTTIPVAIRVPVDVTSGQGSFTGTLSGSTVEYNGGEFYFYDFTVPQGTTSLAADLNWPETGNLVNVYLIDPNGDLRDAKSGDLDSSGYAGPFLVPPDALQHVSEQLVWNAPMAGKWQVLVWAPGFNGESFAMPFEGQVVLDRAVVSPAAWTATVAPGGKVEKTFTLSNGGPTALAAYAASQQTIGGVAQYATETLGTAKGQLTPSRKGAADEGYFVLPQGLKSVTATVTWQSPGSLIDCQLFDPTHTSKAVSLADSGAGNSLTIANPMAGLWSVYISFGDPALPAAPAVYNGTISCVGPVALPGLNTSATMTAPVVVAAASKGTITATFAAPAGAKSGDSFTGTLDFYTTADQMTAAGGDHLGSVPVRITVK